MRYILLIFIIFMFIMQPIQAAKIISTVNSTVETDISNLNLGKMSVSAIILKNGTLYDAYTDDGLLISSEDFNIVYNKVISKIEVGEIVLRAGVYNIKYTLDIWQGILLHGERGATLVPIKNVDMVKMHPGSSISNIIFEPYRLDGYNSAAIVITSDDPWSDFYPSFYRYQIDDIDMWGIDGTAILLNATGTPGYNGENGIGGYIGGIVANNVNILGFDKGLHLLCNTTHSFINGNKFYDFHFTGTEHSVWFEPIGIGSSEIDGNIFENFHVQYMTGMKNAFNISGRYNRISAMIWDWAPDTAVIFQKDSGQNYALLGVDKSKIVDNGVSELMTRNTIVGYI